MITVDDKFFLHQGDCLEVLKSLPDNSVDAICTDPPPVLQNPSGDRAKDRAKKREWLAWMREISKQCYRVVKPGGHALVWAAPRDSHWSATAWEEAGFACRDVITHIFGGGLANGFSVSRAIEQTEASKAGAEQGVAASGNQDGKASDWDGWGTKLKPASEHWIVLRKPLEGTVAENILKYGTGAINVDACRIPYQDGEVDFGIKHRQQHSAGAVKGAFGAAGLIGKEIEMYKEDGRWPANLIHDGSQEAVSVFPVIKTEGGKDKSAALFFYCAQASRADREAGCQDMPETEKAKAYRNNHPEVKNISLMRYLTKMITCEGGTVLDPFMGSGSTGKACALEGFRFIGIDINEDYVKIAEARILFGLQIAAQEASERAEEAQREAEAIAEAERLAAERVARGEPVEEPIAAPTQTSFFDLF